MSKQERAKMSSEYKVQLCWSGQEILYVLPRMLAVDLIKLLTCNQINQNRSNIYIFSVKVNTIRYMSLEFCHKLLHL